MKIPYRGIGMFAAFMAMGLFFTVVVYTPVAMTLMWIVYELDPSEAYLWAAFVATGVIFVIFSFVVYFGRSPEILNISWDSATSEDCPSKTSLPGKGGSLWNMNPLGLESINAIATLIAGAFCAGPVFFFTGIWAAKAEIKKS